MKTDARGRGESIMTGDDRTNLSPAITRTKAIFDAHEVCNPDQDRYPEYPFIDGPVRRCAEKEGMLYDVGCGRGYWFDRYQELGVPKANITGVDLSDAAVSRLKSLGYRAIQAECTKMDGVDSAVADLVIATGSLMVSEDTYRAFKQCRRLMRPGGEILLNLYNIYHPYFWFIHKMTWPLRTYGEKWVRYWWHPFLLFFQVQNYLRRRCFLNRRDLEAVFYDQVMVPYAHLHSVGEVSAWMADSGLTVLGTGYNLMGSMFWVHACLAAASVADGQRQRA